LKKKLQNPHEQSLEYTWRTPQKSKQSWILVQLVADEGQISGGPEGIVL
jgi:hypothetical protein